jgi:hypothetical protein
VTIPTWALTVKKDFFPAGAPRVLVYPSPLVIKINGAEHRVHNA